jgi:hypothetical protein
MAMTIKYHHGILTAAAAGSLLWAVPLLAQTVTTQTTVTQTETTQADPGAAAAQQVNGDQLRNQQTAQQQVEAQRDQQYAEDRAVYEAAVRARGRKIERQDTRDERVQNAYLKAMTDWRIQVEACKKGKNKACDAPAPDPANYL